MISIIHSITWAWRNIYVKLTTDGAATIVSISSSSIAGEEIVDSELGVIYLRARERERERERAE